METTYSEVLQPWQNFYSLTGGAAATLMGLLFVSMSLNPGILAGEGQRHVRVWAGQTMSNLIALLLLSLTCMLPDLDVPAFSFTLFVLGAQGLVRGIYRLRYAIADKSESWQLHHVLLRLVLPICSYAVMIFVAVNVMFGNVRAVDSLVWAVFLLVTGGAGAAWALLSRIGISREPQT